MQATAHTLNPGASRGDSTPAAPRRTYARLIGALFLTGILAPVPVPS
jgi:hypothetical protein